MQSGPRGERGLSHGSGIARIVLDRAFPVIITTSSIKKVRTRLCGEFRDCLPHAPSQNYQFGYCWVKSFQEVYVLMEAFSNTDTVAWSPQNKSSASAVPLAVVAPSEPGVYHLCVFGKMLTSLNGDKPSSLVLLPYISDAVHTVAADSELCSSASATIMLCNYRFVNSETDTLVHQEPNPATDATGAATEVFAGVIIREEYGSTLGSHLYDSSLVLVNYLSTTSAFLDRCDCIIELGAGCGAVGIWIARNTRTGRVILTDKDDCLPFATANVELNAVGDTCFVHKLHWHDEGDIAQAMRWLECSVVLIAADVLYDRDAAVLFFQLVSRLLEHADARSNVLGNGIDVTPESCYLAQKHRHGKDAFDMALLSDQFPSLRATLVHNQYDVSVWLVVRSQNS
jgi:predicted nicotinamide N-methyase